MIRSDAEHKAALQQLAEEREFAERQRSALGSMGLSDEQVAKGMEPLRAFQAQLEEEVSWYEKVRRREFTATERLTEIGRILVALRIANGLSQRRLAERLGVSEASVSRDERNEYHNITVERAQRILDALGERVITSVKLPAQRGKRVPAGRS